MKDRNGKSFENGSVFDIHQTVNGRNEFVVIDIDTLDVRYFYDGLPQERYQYDIKELMGNNRPFTLDKEVEIIGYFPEHTKFINVVKYDEPLHLETSAPDRYFLVYMCFSKKGSVGYNTYDVKVSSGGFFSGEEFIRQLKKSNGYDEVVVTGFNELSKSDYEDYITKEGETNVLNKDVCDELFKLYENYRVNYETLLEMKINVDVRHLEKAKGKMYGSRDAWKLACKKFKD